jgi:hypothetical protein
MKLVNFLVKWCYTKYNDLFIKNGESIIRDTEKFGTNVSIGMEFQPVGNDVKEFETLSNLSLEQLQNYLNLAQKDFSKYKNFIGFSAHDYANYIKYLNKYQKQ